MLLQAGVYSADTDESSDEEENAFENMEEDGAPADGELTMSVALLFYSCGTVIA